MADIKFDLINGIYDITNEFVSGIDVIKQQIYIRFNIPKGEWASDPTIGISLSQLSQFSLDPAAVAQIYADEALQIPNVTSVSVENIDVDLNNRIANITFNISTIYGETTVTIAP
jgi:phage baseplate assembly protein W